MTLNTDYALRHKQILEPLAAKLQLYIESVYKEYSRIDRISVRAKDSKRFLEKAQKLENGELKYSDPLNQIQDQIGARIVTYYKEDVDKLAEITRKYFQHIETRLIVPDAESEFGYEGQHFILFIPRDIFDENIKEDTSIPFFELQIKTLFQHAWAEANHDLGYKPNTELSRDQKRQLAFIAAQAWGADQIFNQLHQQLS